MSYRGKAASTIWVNQADPRLDEAELSAVITSTNSVPLIVERAMYRAGGQVVRRGTRERRGRRAAAAWFFAEGATGGFFDIYRAARQSEPAAATVEADI